MDVMFASEPPTKVSSIIIACGWLLQVARDDAKVKDLIGNLLKFLNLDPLTVDTKWVNIYSFVVPNLLIFGKAQMAVFLLEQVVQIREQTLAEDNQDRLSSQHQLGRAYLDNGQVEKAVVLLELVFQIREQTLAEDDPDRLASLHTLARAYQANKQVEKALVLLEHVSQIGEHALAENHPQRLASQHNLATLFWDLGRREDALHLMRHVVGVQRKVLDEGHPKRKYSEEWLQDWEDEMNETKAAENREI
ncbi:MAG: hypothetical protein Q9197_001888 [Variospora fuerteventurae]